MIESKCHSNSAVEHLQWVWEVLGSIVDHVHTKTEAVSWAVHCQRAAVTVDSVADNASCKNWFHSWSYSVYTRALDKEKKVQCIQYVPVQSKCTIMCTHHFRYSQSIDAILEEEEQYADQLKEYHAFGDSLRLNTYLLYSIPFYLKENSLQCWFVTFTLFIIKCVVFMNNKMNTS